jgi:hypothetical protein
MPDTAEMRAGRVERVLETGDLGGAMNALQREMNGMSPDERGKILRSLEDQNKKANDKDWTLPNVEITQSTKWLGLKNVEGSYDVNFSHGAIEKAFHKANSLNPATKITDALGR